MIPYVIEQGDYLARLAFRFGFDADDVWNDAKNAELKARRDPNILAPGDVLYIPETSRVTGAPLAVGGENSFLCDAPEARVEIRLIDEKGAPHAGKRCVVAGIGEPRTETSDGDGILRFSVPVTLRAVTVTVEDGYSFEASIGCLDPHDEPSGREMRLRNLGFLPDDDVMRPEEDRETRLAGALAAFQRAHGAGSGVDPWLHVATIHRS
jgi:hypothetical protein